MKDDRILPVTRVVAILVIPFLWAAFLILFFFPDSTGERFAWAIKPHMTSLYIGAGYLGGSWLFINVVTGKQWHRIQGGFLAITTFTWFMLIATLLHWNRFSLGTLGFALWSILYIITPVLVPVLWYYNQRTDSGQPEASDLIVPDAVRWVMRLAGLLALFLALAGLFFPNFLISIWPWTLTPLTARVISGWMALLGVGALTNTLDARWSAWRTPLESIFIWQVLTFVATVLCASDFQTGILNWYTVSTAFMTMGILIFYWVMESRRRSLTPS
jgi:hypothetical protein